MVHLFRKKLICLALGLASNQRYHFLTTRYKNLENNLANYYNRLEIRIMKNGQTYVNGLATNEIINVLFDDNLFQPFQGLRSS